MWMMLLRGGGGLPMECLWSDSEIDSSDGECSNSNEGTGTWSKRGSLLVAKNTRTICKRSSLNGSTKVRDITCPSPRVSMQGGRLSAALSPKGVGGRTPRGTTRSQTPRAAGHGRADSKPNGLNPLQMIQSEDDTVGSADSPRSPQHYEMAKVRMDSRDLTSQLLLQEAQETRNKIREGKDNDNRVQLLPICKGANGMVGLEFNGTLVVSVTPGGPAGQAGIMPGMKLISINSERMPDDSEAVKKAFKNAPADFHVTVDTSITPFNSTSPRRRHSVSPGSKDKSLAPRLVLTAFYLNHSPGDVFKVDNLLSHIAKGSHSLADLVQLMCERYRIPYSEWSDPPNALDVNLFVLNRFALLHDIEIDARELIETYMESETVHSISAARMKILQSLCKAHCIPAKRWADEVPVAMFPVLFPNTCTSPAIVAALCVGAVIKVLLNPTPLSPGTGTSSSSVLEDTPEEPGLKPKGSGFSLPLLDLSKTKSQEQREFEAMRKRDKEKGAEPQPQAKAQSQPQPKVKARRQSLDMVGRMTQSTVSTPASSAATPDTPVSPSMNSLLVLNPTSAGSIMKRRSPNSSMIDVNCNGHAMHTRDPEEESKDKARIKELMAELEEANGVIDNLHEQLDALEQMKDNAVVEKEMQAMMTKNGEAERRKLEEKIRVLEQKLKTSDAEVVRLAEQQVKTVAKLSEDIPVTPRNRDLPPLPSTPRGGSSLNYEELYKDLKEQYKKETRKMKRETERLRIEAEILKDKIKKFEAADADQKKEGKRRKSKCDVVTGDEDPEISRQKEEEDAEKRRIEQREREQLIDIKAQYACAVSVLDRLGLSPPFNALANLDKLPEELTNAVRARLSKMELQKTIIRTSISCY